MRKFLSTILLFGLLLTTEVFGQSQNVKIKIDDRQIHCLAQNIYFESRNQSIIGQKAIGLVTLNRLSSGNYAKDICGVVKQRIRGKCQFSWVCDSRTMKKRLTITQDPLYNDILTLSIRIIKNYYYLNDVTKGATYFHASHKNPRWKLQRSVKIENHVFYIKDTDVRSIKRNIFL